MGAIACEARGLRHSSGDEAPRAPTVRLGWLGARPRLRDAEPGESALLALLIERFFANPKVEWLSVALMA
jgi:hypothetical protein